MDEFRKNLFNWRKNDRRSLVSVRQQDLECVSRVRPQFERFDAIFVANHPNIVEETSGAVGQLWCHHPDHAPIGKKNILSALTMILGRHREMYWRDSSAHHRLHWICVCRDGTTLHRRKVGLRLMHGNAVRQIPRTIATRAFRIAISVLRKHVQMLSVLDDSAFGRTFGRS